MMATKGGSGDGHRSALERPAKKHRFQAQLLPKDVLTIPEIALGVIGFVERKELRGVALVCKAWKKAAAARIRSDGPAILVTGGLKKGSARVEDQRETWIFLPKREIWHSTSPLPLRFAEKTALDSKHAAKLHGFAYVVSGSSGFARYDLLDEVWTELPTQQATPECSKAKSIACLNDKVYVMYSEMRSKPFDDRVKNLSFYSFDHINQNLSFCKRITPVARTWKLYQTKAFDDYFYLVGGQDIFDNAVTTVERWRPGMNMMEAMSNMHTGRVGHCLVEAKGHLYVLGGTNGHRGEIIKTCEKYCPESNRWELVTCLPSFRCNISAFAVEELIYVVEAGKYMRPKIQ